MSQDTPKAQLEPLQLTINSRFQFRCGPDLECFTKCCRGIDIVLTPYDIIRMKKRLDLDSEQFLAIYTRPELLEKTDLPVPVLRMLEDEEGQEDNPPCPFVREEGCIIYEDRPAACRYYPLGHATMRPKEGDATEDFFFFVKEPHCKGFEVDKEWTVKEWRKDQGVEEHDAINEGWNELVVRKRSFPPNIKITEPAKKMFYMACYNLDQFRRFVFESTFLTLHSLDEKTIEAIKTDDVALLKVGTEWLKGALFSQGSMKVSDDQAQKRIFNK
ncbi:hypothetical protein SAMN02745216_01023 [Desulfatibacillum alkenivorans DSM 16219]|jgi:Fe-S-cluster containining protein|uniref:Zinc-or iron-chelating domain-containing protein n=1 Tax=Desulfatibacillum alkenivorans DSM 16219 TaxID=1121393 RepID=A0A1M6GIP4_9BACT|nr:YkgJ family cysteine cluster protein [Desulfatibacillum alkenivorans]SHJ09813.1 hypothetical protein SAMN02745216_01023 [Desulfatibacillum alkenivorans DSM 16219]